jgi:phasin family protein
MILFNPEQIAAFPKASLDAAFGVTLKIVEATERLTELNLQRTRSTLAETQENVLKASSAKEPQEWFLLQAALAGPTLEKAQSYGRALVEIMSATQAEFAQVAQTQWEAYNRRVQTLVEDGAKNAPAGSEAAITAWKHALASTQTLIETLQKTSQQAVQMADTGFETVATAAARTPRRTTG